MGSLCTCVVERSLMSYSLGALYAFYFSACCSVWFFNIIYPSEFFMNIIFNRSCQKPLISYCGPWMLDLSNISFKSSTLTIQHRERMRGERNRIERDCQEEHRRQQVWKADQREPEVGTRWKKEWHAWVRKSSGELSEQHLLLAKLNYFLLLRFSRGLAEFGHVEELQCLRDRHWCSCAHQARQERKSLWFC